MRSVLLAVAVSAVLVGAGCSADSAAEPEPNLETPGAFIGRREPDGIRIYRTLSTLTLQNDVVLISEVYAPRAGSFEEARTLAREPGLRLEQAKLFMSESMFTVTEWQVLWFRSPTREELDRVY